MTVVPDAPFLILPEVSSERREYMPIAYATPPTIPSSLVRVALSADASRFALLTSAMHKAWLRFIGGRLKSDYRYSIGLVYNTFPLPSNWAAKRDSLDAYAQAVLDARGSHPDTTLATLYDPDLMPADLRRAHTRRGVKPARRQTRGLISSKTAVATRSNKNLFWIKKISCYRYSCVSFAASQQHASPDPPRFRPPADDEFVFRWGDPNDASRCGRDHLG